MDHGGRVDALGRRLEIYGSGGWVFEGPYATRSVMARLRMTWIVVMEFCLCGV